MFTIYKITNKINNLIYIGCTSRELKIRIQEHFNRLNKTDDFHKAIREFGKDAFVVDIVEYNQEGTKEEAEQREKYWIKYYNSNNPSIGYNRTHGGNGTIGYVFTDEARQKISKSLIGRPVSAKTLEAMRTTWKGKHLPIEMRQKISKSRIGKYTGKDNSFYGKHHNDITKQKISEANSKPIIGTSNKDGNEIYFNSITEASNFIIGIRGGIFNTIHSHIVNSIKEINCKTAYGYKWRYVEKSNDYPDRE